jgi:hypothetical protein
VSAITAATCGSVIWDDHLQVSLDVSRRRLLCFGETDNNAQWRNADKCPMPDVSKQIINVALWLHRWDGLRQAVCLHKCLFYFVHDHQIWVGMDHLQLAVQRHEASGLCSVLSSTDDSMCIIAGKDAAVLRAQWLHLSRQVRRAAAGWRDVIRDCTCD